MIYLIPFTRKSPKTIDKGLFLRKIENYFRVCKRHNSKRSKTVLHLDIGHYTKEVFRFLTQNLKMQ